MIVDGRALAAEVLARAKARAAKLARRPKVVALTTEPTAATRSYLKIKERSAAEAGCDFEVRHIDIAQGIQDLSRSVQTFDSADAIIVQLPLPEGIDAKAACDAIPVEKDADVLSSAARTRFMDIVSPYLLPPVVGAVKEILEYGKVEIQEKRAVVIGAGFLVGAPVATWLQQQGAEVEVITMETGDLAALKEADLIVSGAGSPHLIKPDMLKEDAVLIDAGTSESGGALVGDADPACAKKCSLFTPVPGGVGPLAVACLFANAITLAQRGIDKPYT